MAEVIKNIYQRINAVISEGLYTKRGSAGQGTGVLYDEVIALLTPFLTKHGIVFNVEKAGEARQRANAKGNYIYEADFNIHYVNVDDPSDRFTTLVEAHAMDAGDKAPGKAITYATKISLLKVFQIETGLNDEARGEAEKVVSTVQVTTIKNILENDEMRISAFCQNNQINSIEDIPKREFKGAVEAANTAMNRARQ